MTIHVDFQPVGRRGECPEGSSVLDCARQLGVGLVNLCGGAGSCGRCKVQVLEGDISAPTLRELETLGPQELAEGFRLACLAIPATDCKIRIPPDSLTAPQRTQVEALAVPVKREPPVVCHTIAVSPPSLGDLRADAERVLDALAEATQDGDRSFDVEALRALSPLLRQEAWQISVALRGREIVAVGPSIARPLGLAVDLGTTKIAGYLLDLETGETVASRGLMNPQIAYGEDLIARMAYAEEAPSQAEQMQRLVINALNQMVAELCAEVGAEPTEILEAVLVGNTAMHHLLLRLPVEQLARAPYVPAVRSALDIKGRDLGLHIAPGGNLHLLPNIAGYVGADHVAMLLATGMAEAEGVVLALDIGTNTEVCLVDHGRLTSLSCASGPAFEGAHISHGMRAAEGAIEHLRLVEGRVEYNTVGDAPPVGLCGSGILDSLAQLFEAGVVNHKGRMGEHALVRRSNGQRVFVLVSEEEQAEGRPAITFSQKDVRELQLAKGAIRTGIQVLLETSGLSADRIDRVVIAGAFGTYINVASAITIGMLPAVPLERFQQVGNAAGMGARLALISERKRAEAWAMADRVGYVELATAPQFTRTFAQSMYLGRELF